ncbi:WD40 repeat domain-containing protein [Microbispora sp. GKU 823]|uniref:WD40 repeat domain-containing protein n=1 Tax=Microbispora sp. GKU 823 TaxID=1652100 RepID=UPI0009A26F1C|nr:WD40 repeat domain-containing protein [Microbispora sp. GKU 823]OPG12486.1 hypothetical protein B1L11_13925 [Microbispora sp. GKU 823]
MAQRAAASRPADPVLARRLSLAAWRISRVSEAKGELLDSMSSPMSDSFADPYGTQGSLYALSPDGARLASYTPRGAGERGDLRIHDVAGKKLIAGVRWENQVTGLAFSPDSRTMAVADLSGVWLWPVHGEPRRGSPLIPWTEPQRPVTLTFSPGGRFITVVGEDVTETWDVERRVRVLSEEVVQVGPDDRLALVIPWQVRAVTAEMTSGSRKSGPRARRVELWDLVRGGRVDAPWLPARATTGAFSPDGRLLALATDEKGVVLFDLATGKAGGEPLDPSAEGLEFSADGRFLAAYSEGRVSLWSVRDGTRRVSVTLPPTGPDLLHRLSSGGRLLRVADSSGTVHTYDLSPHMGSGTLAPGTEARRFSPDGRLIAVATGKRDGWKVWIWDVATRKPLGAAEPDDPPENASPEGEGYEPVFSPDGRTLALTHPMSRVVTLWDVATNARIGAFELRWRGAGGVSRLVFSSDGRTVAVTPNSADDRDDVTELELWDLATRTWRRSFPMEAADLSFLPDGRLLALKRSTDPRRPLEGGQRYWTPPRGRSRRTRPTPASRARCSSRETRP